MIGGMLLSLAILTADGEVIPSQCSASELRFLQRGAVTYDPSALQGTLVGLNVAAVGDGLRCSLSGTFLRPRAGLGQVELRRGDVSLRLMPSQATSGGYSGNDRIKLDGLAAQTIVGSDGAIIDLFEIEPGQFVPTGDYQANLEWVGRDQSVVPIELLIRVEPALRLIDDEVRRLSLGEVSQGSEVHSNFFYRTNANLRVTATSQHGGRLVHELGGQFGSIPYRAVLADQVLALAAGSQAVLPLGRSALHAAVLSVSVEPQKASFSGVYRDVLTLEFHAY